MRVALALLLVLAQTAFAQQRPRSFSESVGALSAVAREVMPAVDLDRLRAEDLRRSEPYRFAEAIPASYTLDNSGTWDSLRDGSRVWRLRFLSAGAQTLNLGFTRFDLPAGATLWLYDESRRHVSGPYTASNRTGDGQLWTPVIPGDALVVEVHVPRGSDAVVEVGFINHGYRGFGDDEAQAKSHGTCNIDVTCPEGNPWRSQKRAVARYSINGTTLCSGTLMNNTAQDRTPYFLTADHCGITTGNAGTLVSYWNYESPVCGLHDDGSLVQNQTGATLRAVYASCDFALVELAQRPPFNVFYSGWNATGTTPTAGVGIHHPGAHVKSISVDEDPLESVIGECTFGNVDAWRVGAWEQGTTERGSSGSCIWDPADGACVGTLSCGDAACAGGDPNDGSDYYGKLSCAWTGGGTAATRLSDWLDPLGSGSLTQEGLEPRPCPPYSFLVRTGGKVGNGGVVDGSIGANDVGGYVRLGRGVLMTDRNVIAGDRVRILADASVCDVLAGALTASSGASIRGSQGSPILPLTNPFCPIPSFTCGGPDVVVPAGGAMGPLPPGTYAKLAVQTGGTLTLAKGTFQFCSVHTARNATVRTTGALQSTINVVNRFRLANASIIGPAVGTPAPVLNVAGTSVRMGAGSELEAFVSAPNAVMSIGRTGILRGTFCASRARSDKRIRLECLEPPTTTSATTTPPPAVHHQRDGG